MRRALVLVGVLLACAAVERGAGAQDQVLGRPIAIEDPRGAVLPRVQRALRRAERGDGVARLAFWGASHTASDQYPGFLRERLIARFGDGGHGLVMPAMPFPLYARRDLAIDGPGWTGLAVRGRDRRADRYGRAGYAIETTTPTFARVRVGARRAVRHVEAWALAQPGGGTLSLVVDGSEVRSAPSAAPPGTIYLEADVARAGRVEVRSAGDGPVRLFGVLLESGAPGVIVESFGVPGARARDQLPWHEATLREQVARRPPDLVALAYGTNESGDRTPLSELDRDLHAVIARWRAVAPDAAILVIGPSDWPRLRAGRYAVRPRTTEVRDLYRRVALAEGCGFFDLLAFQGGAGSIPRWVAAGLALDDHVHLTDEGHARLAAALERALLAGY